MTTKPSADTDDKRWLAQLIDENSGLVFGTAYALTRNFEEAEDLSQDTFLRAWENRQKLQNHENAAPWLYQTARNAAISKLRKKSEQIQRNAVPLEIGDRKQHLTSLNPSPLDAAAQQEEAKLLSDALAEIPDRYRIPLVLFYLEEERTSGIASVLKISDEAVRKRLSRGRSMLREDLQERLDQNLQQRKPGQKFAASVMAAIAAGVSSTISAGSVAGAGVSLSKGTVVSIVAVAITLLIIIGGVVIYQTKPEFKMVPLQNDTELVEEIPENDFDNSTSDNNNSESEKTDENSTIRLTFIVEEPDGQPSNNSRMYHKEELIRSTEYDSSRFEFEFKSQDDSIDLYFESLQGCASYEINPTEIAANKTETIRLRNETEIKGTIFDTEKGEPVVGMQVVVLESPPVLNNYSEAAPVEIETMEGDCYVCLELSSNESLPIRFANNLKKTKILGEAITDENGEYSITPLKATGAGNSGLYVYPVIKSSRPYEFPPVEQTTMKPNQDPVFVDYDLSPGELLLGSVKNGKGDPVPNTTLTALSNGSDTILRTLSDENGEFIITGLKKGQHVSYVGASHEDYEPFTTTDIDPLGGSLNIVLEQKLKLSLQVIDGKTEKPVPHYQYQYLFETYSGWNPDDNFPVTVIQNVEGKIDLQGFEGRKLKVLVRELNGNGLPTGKIGSSVINLDFSGERKQHQVKVFPAGILQGRVTLADGETPVPDATVGFEKMSHHHHHGPIDVGQEFQIPDVKTDENGFYVIPAVMPGTYTMVVQETPYAPAEPLIVEIPENQKSTTFDISLDAKAEIFGYIMWNDETPADNVFVRAIGKHEKLNLDINHATISRKNGYFEFTNLPNALWKIHLSHDDISKDQTKYEVRIYDQSSNELNIALEKSIEFNVVIEDEPEDFGRLALYMTPTGGGKRVKLGRKSNPLLGTSHSAMVPPGNYVLGVGEHAGVFYYRIIGNASGYVLDEIEVKASPNKQFKKVSFELTTAEVIIESENLLATESGMIELDQRLPDGTIQPSIDFELIKTKSKIIPNIIPGEYRVRYRSINNSITGESDWTEIKEDEKGLFVVLMDEEPWEQLDEWKSGELGAINDVIIRRYPLSQVTSKKSGTVQVMFDYITGHHGMQIDRVSLVSGGRVITEDRHIGWSASTEIQTLYEVEIPEGFITGNLEIEIGMTSSTGSDSNGVIYARGIK